MSYAGPERESTVDEDVTQWRGSSAAEACRRWGRRRRISGFGGLRVERERRLDARRHGRVADLAAQVALARVERGEGPKETWPASGKLGGGGDGLPFVGR